MHYLRQAWRESKVFRIILVVAAVYAVLRLAVHGAYLAMMLYPNAGVMGGMPEWTGAEGEPMVPADLQIYLDAAKHFRQQQDLYLKGSLERLEDHYPYGPSFALAFIPFLWLSPVAVSIVHTLLHILAYGVLYVLWWRVFHHLGFERAGPIMIWTLPVWIVFSAFWGDLGYLNIYLIMTLFGTFYIESILYERLGWSVLWLTIILQIKPHWAFATAVPLLLGRYRFFFKLVALALLAYVVVAGVVFLVGGPEYVGQQYIDYVNFLRRLSRDFPWRGPDDAYLGYNHSIKQVVFYFLGITPFTMRLVSIVKVLFLLPLAIVSLRYFFHPGGHPGYKVPQLGLDLAFVFYLGAFIWLDMVWEVSLGVAIFVYLLATLKHRTTKTLVWGVFLPYAMVDFWQVISFAVFGMDVIDPGPYVLTDPSIYIPMIMVVILVFYGLLVKRLWQAVPSQQAIATGAE